MRSYCFIRRLFVGTLVALTVSLITVAPLLLVLRFRCL